MYTCYRAVWLCMYFVHAVSLIERVKDTDLHSRREVVRLNLMTNNESPIHSRRSIAVRTHTCTNNVSFLFFQASHLLECGYNHGALLVAGLFLSEEDTAITTWAIDYLNKFTERSPWHKKAVRHYTELLENSDQEIRVGACLALGHLKVTYYSILTVLAVQ